MPWTDVIMRQNTAHLENEHGYFRSTTSGRGFQFFGAHFISTSRIDMRVSVFDKYTFPLHEKIIE